MSFGPILSSKFVVIPSFTQQFQLPAFRMASNRRIGVLQSWHLSHASQAPGSGSASGASILNLGTSDSEAWSGSMLAVSMFFFENVGCW